jgi:hypothetical protein
MGLLWEIIIGILAGFLASKIVKGSGIGHLAGPTCGHRWVRPRRLGLRPAGPRCVWADRPARHGHDRRHPAAAHHQGDQTGLIWMRRDRVNRGASRRFGSLRFRVESIDPRLKNQMPTR